jgi:release factor glutamine methyltransferase
MQSSWRIRTNSLGAWLDKGLKAISTIELEHSSSLYALLNNILKHPTSWILTHLEYPLDPEEESSLNAKLARLLSGEPLAYINGKQSFFGLEFLVTYDVLIPRPETELLVEEAIRKSRILHDPLMIADVGTGSGCIAVSLAKSLPDIKICATDISFKALQVAKQNIQDNQVESQIILCQTFLLDGIENKFDLICANLPYIPTKKLNALPILKFEPRLALDGGNDGFILIMQLLENIKDKIQPNGIILLEIEETQKQKIFRVCKILFPTSYCTILDDLAGLPRLAIINLKE